MRKQVTSHHDRKKFDGWLSLPLNLSAQLADVTGMGEHEISDPLSVPLW